MKSDLDTMKFFEEVESLDKQNLLSMQVMSDGTIIITGI